MTPIPRRALPVTALPDLRRYDLHRAGLRMSRSLPDADGTGFGQIVDFVARGRLGRAALAPAVPAGWLQDRHAGQLEGFLYSAEASEALAAGVLAGLGAPAWPEGFAPGLLGAALGVDAPSQTLRRVLLGRDVLRPRPRGPVPLPAPDDVDKLNKLAVAGIFDALSRVAANAAQRPRPWADAVVTSISEGCAGDSVTVVGSGFGTDEPDDVLLLCPVSPEGHVAATITSWSETTVEATLPAGVRRGCAGFVQVPRDGGNLSGAMEYLAGVMVQVLGPAAAESARRLRTAAGSVQLPRPDCSHPSAMAFTGGPPELVYFSANGGSGTVPVDPGDNVSLAWDVPGAAEVFVTRRNSPDPAQGPFGASSGILVDGPEDDGDELVYELSGSNVCGTVTAQVRLVARGAWALVLSGGGAKGAFEVGAVRCLTELGYEFDMFVGTSVGALNAAKLAESEAQSLVELESLWLGLTKLGDFFQARDWFATLSPILQSLFRASTGSGLGMAAAEYAHSWFTRRVLGTAAQAWGIPGLAVTMLTSFIPTAQNVIDVVRLKQAVDAAMSAESLYDPAPLIQLIADHLDEAKIASSGKTLRVVLADLGRGRRVLVDETGNLDSGRYLGLHRGVLASASIPVAVPPVGDVRSSRTVDLGGVSIPLATQTDWYADGGVVQNAPIAEAVAAGATRVVAVLCSPQEVERLDLDPLKVEPVVAAARAADMLLTDLQREETSPWRGWQVPVRIIAPEFLVHDTLTVDPGLIRINMAYGYLRAFDELGPTAASRAELWQLTRTITLLRLDAWATEFRVSGRYPDNALVKEDLRVVPSAEALQHVRVVKREICQAVTRRRALTGDIGLPPQPDQWWLEFEEHVWQPIMADPWQEFGYDPTTNTPVPAEPPPQP